MSPSKLVPWALALSAGSGLVGCGPGTGAPSAEAPAVVERIFDETGETFSPEALVESEPVFSWSFQSGDRLEEWRHRGLQDLRAESRHLSFRKVAQDAFLERRIDLDARSIDQVEVEVLPPQAPWQLRWQYADGRLSPPLVARRDPHRRPPMYRFDVGSHEAWRGTIRALRFEPGHIVGATIQLQAVHGIHRTINTERLATARSRSWKVEIDDESRTARLATDGDTLRETLRIPDAARLTVAYASPASLGKRARFDLELLRDGEPVASRRAVVASGPDDETQGPGEGAEAPDRWHELEIDLEPWAGEQVEMILSTSIERSREHDLVFWGDARITTRRGAAKRPDVVLILVDTLRADRTSLYGNPRETTPKIEAWARSEATTFESVVAASPWTYPSHLSLFTGLDALSHGQHNGRPLRDRFELLAQRLQAAGYRTLAVTAGGYLDPYYGFAAGFDRYYAYPGDEIGTDDLVSGVERARRWLDHDEGPTFLFLHTFEVHSPYRIREPFYEKLTGSPGDPAMAEALQPRSGEIGDTAGATHRRIYTWRRDDGRHEPLEPAEHQVVRDIYDASLAFADHHLGSLIEHVETTSESPLIVVTSDHGEALGEHDLAEHAYLYDFNLLVPLVIRLPDGRGAGTRIAPQVRQVDIAPTLLEALELPVPDGIDGVSLLPLVEDPEATFDEPAWSAATQQGLSLRRSNRLKYIVNHTLYRHPDSLEALFSLSNDPSESHDLATTRSTDSLRRAAIQRYRDGFSGLWIELANRGEDMFHLSLQSAPRWLNPSHFKSVDGPGVFLRTSAILAIRIPPGETFSVALEQVAASDRLAFELRDPNDASCRIVVGDGPADVEAEHPLRILTFAEGCRPDSAAGDLSIRFEYRGSGVEVTRPASDVPADVEERLRALGYVD